jgi:transcriptional regulator with XRE-family HTH domain
MAKLAIPIDTETSDALKLLGAQIRLARHAKGWTAENLAQRVGVSKRTMLAVEAGSASVAVGTVFSAAVVAGVPLFQMTGRDLAREVRSTERVLALLPSRVDRGKKDLDDAF